ncbi:hypothetical protein CC2G_014185 [Coprinopsis cinerea AmutBmut pab1-1]|nr:hypothetical protein CC2G_014185 [Coprinopsis cinerea AmutBmut pab1-1]
MNDPPSPLSSLPPSSDLPWENEALIQFSDAGNEDEQSDYNYPPSPTPAQGSLSLPLKNVVFRLPLPLGLRSTPSFAPTTPYQQRASSLPPLSSASKELVASQPPLLTKADRQKHNRKEGAAQGGRTRKAKAEAKAKRLEEEEAARVGDLARDVLAYMEKKELTFGDFVEYVFNPDNKRGDIQWEEFFRKPTRVTRILDWWMSSANSATGRGQVEEWAVSLVENLVKEEARDVTGKGLARRKVINDDLVSKFSIDEWYNRLRNECATVTTRIFDAVSQSVRQVKKGLSEGRKARKRMTVVSSILSCFAEYSTFNNILKRVLGLYLYATGAQRQLITVLSHLGITESWSRLVGGVALSTVTTDTIDNESATNDSSPSSTKDKSESPGTLQQLSTLMRQKSRGLAALVTYGSVYDNVNFTERVGEQIIGRSNSVESATAATIWPLHKARMEDMKLEDLNESFDTAEPLLVSDILHSSEEDALFTECLTHCILRIVVAHGGEGFKKFEKKLAETLPRTDRAIDVHKTDLHPLPTWKIDESSIVGNAEVVEAITKELQLRNQPATWMKYARIIAGDQLSIARLRALANLRAGHEDAELSLQWGVWMPGLFHAKIADMHGFFTTHWGKANAGVRNPGCLAFHNTLLRNHPISITSLPAFRTCRDLVFVSLYARVLHCLLQVSGHATLEDYCDKVNTWEEFYAHGQQIHDEYASTRRHHILRSARGPVPPKEKTAKSKKDHVPPPLPKKGDMVLENAILFLRDSLISREFTDAVKSGDSGRVVLVLKIWALSFRGNGRTKYAYEMLSIIHNLQKVWPKPIADIVLNNWLLNPTGRPNSFVEVDLVQEHMNFWIKTFYKARGSNSSWEWLEMISPCIQALRHLCNVMKDTLGTNNGSRHAPASLSKDIALLMDSLKLHGVYSFQEGRQLDPDDPPTVDVISTGYNSLRTPLEEYNETFKRMQERRRMTPAVDVNEDSPYSTTTQPASSSQPSTRPPDASTPSAEAAPVSARTQKESGFVDDGNASEGEGENEDGNEKAPGSNLDLLSLDEDEPTLQRLGLEDVEFDMDTVEPEEEEESDDEDCDEFTLDDVLA